MNASCGSGLGRGSFFWQPLCCALSCSDGTTLEQFFSQATPGGERSISPNCVTAQVVGVAQLKGS